MDADELARTAGEAMWRADRSSKWLGMQLEEIRAGYTRISMSVTADMTNGQAMCHGGLIFTLADSSFGFACNSRNQRAVAQTCTITYLHPAQLGERLVATAQERATAGRSALYDVQVHAAARVVAEFRGQSRMIGGAVVP